MKQADLPTDRPMAAGQPLRRLVLLGAFIGLHACAWAKPDGADRAPSAIAAMAADPLRTPAHPAVEMAKSLLGIAYRWGGADPARGFDCSGLVYYVFNRLEVQVPRMPRDVFRQFDPVGPAELQPGDVLFFHTFAKLSHVGIYIGQGRFIHAPRRGQAVAVESMDSSYYRKRYAGARRVMGIPPLAAALEPQAPGPSLAGL